MCVGVCGCVWVCVHVDKNIHYEPGDYVWVQSVACNSCYLLLQQYGEAIHSTESIIRIMALLRSWVHEIILSIHMLEGMREKETEGRLEMVR